MIAEGRSDDKTWTGIPFKSYNTCLCCSTFVHFCSHWTHYFHFSPFFPKITVLFFCSCSLRVSNFGPMLFSFFWAYLRHRLLCHEAWMEEEMMTMLSEVWNKKLWSSSSSSSSVTLFLSHSDCSGGLQRSMQRGKDNTRPEMCPASVRCFVPGIFAVFLFFLRHFLLCLCIAQFVYQHP